MIPVADVRSMVLAACTQLAPRRVACEGALGHVLAEPVRAPEDVPSFANSAMDGYALRAADTAASPARLRVTGSLMAGEGPGPVVGDGEAVRIMTGAPLPRGADAVCMIEHTREEKGGAVVVVEHAVREGTHVREAGDDVRSGTEVFGPGTQIAPAHLGVLASLGIASVLVRPRPRVGVVSTGDELDSAPGTLPPGKVRDANRPAVLAQLHTDGFGMLDMGIVGDDEAVLASVLERGARECDAVVTSGGVSVGDRDVVRIVLDKLGDGTMRWMQVAVKPAKPFAFGTLAPAGTPVFGLPGNPVSALVSYELFVRPALRAMAGHVDVDRPRLLATAAVDLPRSRDGKLHLVRVRAQGAPDGTIRVRPSGGQGSHMLRGMAEANGLALLPDGDGVAAGAPVEVLVFDAQRLVPAAGVGPS